MHLLILHNAVADNAEAADRDVLTQVAAIGAALTELSHTFEIFGCDLDLAALQRRLVSSTFDLVFNLVESLGGTDRLMHLVPALLEGLDIPYTGSPSRALQETGDKLAAKMRLRDAGLPTAPWVVVNDAESAVAFVPGRWLIKAIHEHASFGLDDDCVVTAASASNMLDQIRRVESRIGRPCFAERFIDGREFNLSLLAGDQGPEVLPVAEIEFVGYAPDQPRIVGYRAKWEEDSAEYQGTPRRFQFDAEDAELLSRLRHLASACWNLWGLRGYARVDFRVDADQNPWILEVNGNPCLSPDAGFAAALERAGIGLPEAVARILRDTEQARGGVGRGRTSIPTGREGTSHVSNTTRT